ncbi:metal-dependent hydrolase [Rossellomorea aquimaris]
MYKTHLATSITAGMVFAKLLSYPFTIGYLGGVAIGSLLPDIDHPNSFIGRRSFGISNVIYNTFGHRGITHSLILWFVLLMLLSLHNNYFTIGIALGYLFHILGDFFSRSGVPLLHPYTKNRFRFFITYRTSSYAELLIFYLSIALGLLFVINNEEFITPLVHSLVNLLNYLVHTIIKFIEK